MRTRIAEEAAALVPHPVGRRKERLDVGRDEAAGLAEREELALAGPHREVVFQRRLLRLEQRPGVKARHAADPHPPPVLDHKRGRPVAGVVAQIEEPDHLRAIRKGAEALAVAPRQPELVEQAVGAPGIEVGETVEQLLAEIRGIAARIDLGRLALAVELRVDDLAAVDRQRERLAEAPVVEQLVLPPRLGARRIHRAIEHRVDGEERA